MLQDFLWLILSAVVMRAVWRVINGAISGAEERPRPSASRRQGGVPTEGVQMVRDPVCGTYVVPDRALAIADGSRQVSFCSAACRDKYRARTA